MSDEEQVRLILTPEQRDLVHRISGQHVDAIELHSDAEQSGGMLRLLWRTSAATGIPRQKWIGDDGDADPPTKPST